MAKNDPEIETWEANGRIVLHKSNSSGVVTPTLINRGKKFTVTALERQQYADRCASEEQDPFKNGLLSPVRLIEGSEAERFYADHPNTMTEEGMKELFKAHPKTFEKKVSEITSPFILHRMLELAKSEDEGATLRQSKLIEARVEEIAPKGFTEIETNTGARASNSFTPAI